MRSGGGQSLLLRDGEHYYRATLRDTCGSLPTTSRVDILTAERSGRLCASGTRIRTDRDTCMVREVQTITVEEFAKGRRHARG